MTDETHRAITTVWRQESAKIIGALSRLTRDVPLAEELAQDALVAALETWPRQGLPDKPAAWLMTTAKHRALDRLRHVKLSGDKLEQLGHELDAREAMIVPDFVDDLDDERAAREIGDDVLRLMFCACHPVLGLEARVALTLKMVAGLTTGEIARAYLQSEPTVAQRLVRAKRTLGEANVPFELPRGEALTGRLTAVLEVLYLIFNEGYAATSGERWIRQDLCDEALRLARMLVRLAPREGEVHGLLALMELQASRASARVDAQGQPVLLLEQDRSTWDQGSIERGLAALATAERLAAEADDGEGPGPYALQAAIAACHARARRAEDTDWPRIAALYEVLAIRQPSPVVELNRAVALSMAFGPAVGLEIVDRLMEEPALKQYPWLPSVRADLLAKLGRNAEAKEEFERAAAMTANARERELLLRRAREQGH
ncbi:RNA polymerase subunit sigma-24 [Roseateles chitinivorans]|uniref:RNA polymerase subunit sigma-24 n=1 Tax=Roseateles chitinivorans TaxID=2917965 RepID=A0A2G9C6Q2_9BURK|nr:RNA polymerase sigma factor [Roseateles chitinivorans]PIM52022.1 RNA polymerase subunit sigma-24 [Roseateles chitinivorans]